MACEYIYIFSAEVTSTPAWTVKAIVFVLFR